MTQTSDNKITNGNLNRVLLFLLYIFFIILIALRYRNDFNSTEIKLYWTLLAAYLICGGLFVIAKYRHNIYFFEPFVFASVLYFGIFIYRPIEDLYNHSMSGNGMDVSSGGASATILFVCGYVCFYIGYFFEFRIKSRDYQKNWEQYGQEYKEETDQDLSSNFALLLWMVSFALCVTALVSTGVSLRYIFSLANEGEKVVNENNTALLFLSNFGVTMITCWLMVLVTPGKKLIKVIITVLSLIYIIMRNGRWLFLIFFIAPFVYYYTKKKSRPNTFALLGVFFLLLIGFAWMQFNRNNIATGRSMTGLFDNWLTIDTLLAPFDSDLTTYKVFYSMVTRFPSEYPFMLGTTFLYVFVLFVPRILWNNKPDNPIRDMIEHSMNNLARRNGSAVANIGEFYANFGIPGIVFLMFLFGKIISKLKQLYENPTKDKLIAYAIILPLLFQWVARGNFSGNFYTTLFAMLPFIIKWFIQKVKL